MVEGYALFEKAPSLLANRRQAIDVPVDWQQLSAPCARCIDRIIM
jgi:hypothetical protein